jgi:hypothetical protein
MKNLLFSIFCLTSLAGCAQQKLAGVKRVDAFSQVRQPGIVRVDHSKNGINSLPDTLYFIYMQAGKEIPSWKRAWSANQSYNIETIELQDSIVQVGIDNKSGKEIRIVRIKGQRLFRLLLKRNATYAKPQQNIRKDEVIIEGEANGKKINYTVNKIIALQSPMYQ